MFPGIESYDSTVNDIISAFEEVGLDLNMGKSLVNKLFNKKR